MTKETYEQTKFEVIAFTTKDVLTGSDDPNEYELERNMFQPPMV